MGNVTVDLVTNTEDQSTWRLILVEQGPWDGNDPSAQLRRVQDRLYNSIDAAIDGQLAERFPESLGKRVIIRLEGYNLPSQAVQSFFTSFSSQVLALPDYASALNNSRYVSDISFELSLEESAAHS